MNRISVIIPMFNAERYLEAALDSVLAQTYPPSEIVMVDDGSTDNTISVARDFQHRHTSKTASISLLTQSNAGPGAARNAGVTHSTGDLLAFLDADDLWAKEKLAWQIAEFTRDSELELITGEVRNFFSPELDPSLQDQVKFAEETMRAAAIPGAILVRRAAFLRAGGFDANLRFGDFLPWFAKTKDIGIKIASVDRPVLLRRVHLTNFSRSHQQNRRDYLVAAKRILDERRRAGQSE